MTRGWRVELHRKRETTLKLRSIYLSRIFSSQFDERKEEKERKGGRKKTKRNENRFTTELFIRWDGETRAGGKMARSQLGEYARVVSLSQHRDIPSKLQSTNSHDYGPTSLYCCFEWPVRVALVSETKPRENDRARDMAAGCYSGSISTTARFPDSIAIAASWRGYYQFFSSILY